MSYFYPRPPRGGRHDFGNAFSMDDSISIHALREEGDGFYCTAVVLYAISIHALREEGDALPPLRDIFDELFLSTPSARRATVARLPRLVHSRYFYPRPPRGGRPDRRRYFGGHIYFYPRPPRGGRPPHYHPGQCLCSDFYPRPPRGGRRQKIGPASPSLSDFYPRPPRGGRRT